MYLEKLEIQGFKSFAKNTILIFNRELTTIVGPNGSGKSNIADAVRWVLGEQSVKTLRGKKSDDVIFAGSDKKGRLGFAQVDLYLNNQDNLLNLDYEQIIVSRKIDRNGESEYLLNGNKVRLLDIQLLLAQANFGQKTYSVIGQGMIDSILTSSAAERKEFFDEATGVKQFQIKKEQSISKLEHAKENLSQSEQILAELEPRLKSLQRQVNKLERRESLEVELKTLQNDYYSFLLSNLNLDLHKKNTAWEEAKIKVSQLNQILINLQTNLDKISTSDSRQEKFQALQAKLNQAQKDLNLLEKEKALLEGKLDLKYLSSGQGDLVWLKNRQAEINNNLEKNKLLITEKNKAYLEKLSLLEELENKQALILEEFKKLETGLQNDQDFSVDKIAGHLENILVEQNNLLLQIEDIKDLSGLATWKISLQNIKEQTKSLWNNLKSKPQDKQINWQIEFNQLLKSKDNLVTEINEVKTQSSILKHSTDNILENNKVLEQELAKLQIDLKKPAAGEADQELKKQLEILLDKIKNQEAIRQSISEEMADFNAQEEKIKTNLVADQQKFRQVQSEFNAENNQLNEIKISVARLETKKEDLEREIEAEAKDFVLQKEIQEVETDLAKQKIVSLKNQLSAIGAIDEAVVNEYQEVNERYQFLSKQIEDLQVATSHLEKIIKDLDNSIASQFDEAFFNINKLFISYFKKLFNGGKAELLLDIKEVALNPKTEETEEENIDIQTKKQYGIEILATPPGKKLSSINMLSGGEKAMTSIALICAIIANNPSPFVVLDEVDAALDEANSIRLADILHELSDKTQFIAITHNRALMHKAKIIYGVTMGDDGVSNLLSISFDKADEIAA